MVAFGIDALAANIYVNVAKGRDWQTGLSPLTPKKTIQAAIDAAAKGDTVVIAGGTYLENLRLSKAITLHAYEPQTVKIDGRQAGSCLCINDGAAGCVIDGLTFTRGAPTNSGNKYGGGVNCHVDATIRNCAFLDNGNKSTTFAGGLHTDNGSNVLVQNCLFAGNYAWASGGATLTEGSKSIITFDRCTAYGNTSDNFIGNQGGIVITHGSTGYVRGCILWGNSGYQLAGYGSYYAREATAHVAYSCVQGGVAANGIGHFYNDGGNISGDPRFVNPPKRNFYFPNTSPCWRTGHPDYFEHDGYRSHMGFYPPRPELRPAPPAPPEPITITLDAQGGECAVETIKRNVWEEIGVLPTPIRDNYDFLGWYDAAEGGNAYRSGSKSDKDLTFYAHWQIRIPPLLQVVAPDDNAFNTNAIAGLAKLQYRLPDSNTVEGVTCAMINLDGELLTASIQDSDEWMWQPRSLGKHILTYTVVTNSVTNTMSCAVNVTALTFATDPEPNPPMAVDSNIMLTGTGRTVPAGGKSATISTQGSGTWTAAVSNPDWMFLSATSGEAGKSVQFTVNANTNVAKRIGYYYISGHSYQITQDGAQETTLSEDEIECESDGLTGTVDLEFTGRYGWDAHSDVDWITISPTHGVGAATITYTVAPLEYVTTREGYVTIGASRFRVFQYGRRMRLSRYEADATDYYPDVFPIEIHALASTEWDVTLNNSWLSAVYVGTGTGRKDATFAAGTNVSYRARSGSVTIGTETLVINQPGTTDLSFEIAPVNTTASVNGANGHIAATATPDLPWTAKSNDGWLTLTEASKEGAGNANLYYTASPNSTLYERTGTITITPGDAKLGPITHTVVQPAAVATRSSEGYQFRASGESTEISVTVSGQVSWDVAESLDWLYIDSSTNYTGSGTVTLRATANDSIEERSGVIRLAGRDFNVSQLGRGFEVECDTTSFDTWSDSGYITISTDGDIDWTATSDSDWLNFDDGSTSYSGYGSQDIIFYIDEYLGDGMARTATVTIGSKEIYITQSAYAVSISPSAATVSGNAGAGEIAVSASSEDVWNALVVLGAKDWITSVTFSAYDPINKKGTISYTYAANDSGVARRCTISINGAQYDLAQAARVVVNIDAAIEGHGTIEGAGEVSQGEKVSLTAIPDDGYAFAYWIDPNGEKKEQNPLTVTADVAKSVTAYFTALTPEILSCTSGTNGVELVWTNLAWAAEYRIYRAPTSEIPSDPLTTITSGGECKWLDESGELEKSYWYWIEAVGAEEDDPTTTRSEIAAGGKRVKAIIISPITYENLKGATHSNPSTYQEEVVYVFTAPSAVEGYTFAGWSPASIATNFTGALTVTANWTANSYSIVYHANGGSGTMANTACTYDKDATIAANGFTRTGYEFLGWATTESGDVAYGAGDIVRNLTSNQSGVIELYAVWEKEEPTECEAPVVTPADGAIFIDDSAVVTISCPTEGATIYYSTTGSTPKTSDAYKYSAPFTITNTTTVKAVAVYVTSGGDTLKSAYVTVTITRKTLTLADAVGATNLVFTTGGDADWSILVGASADASDEYCLKSGAIGDSQSSWLETTVTGAGEFSFSWKANCEWDDSGDATWDHLAYAVDGAEKDRIDGSNDWAKVTVTLAEGTHTIRWTYTKDESDKGGDDCAYLDAVSWSPAASGGPTVEGDDSATVSGDAESGYTVTVTDTDAKITLPDEGEVKIVVKKNGCEIQGYLDIPAAVGGVIDLANATVKEEIVKETLDPEKGAEIELDAANPTIKTAATKPGLTYEFYESSDFDDLVGSRVPRDRKVGDGTAWSPTISVKGGKSGFYKIGVTK